MNTEKPFVFRSSFAELQVGDEILSREGGWAYHWYKRHTITALTKNWFRCGDMTFTREHGRRVGGLKSGSYATLPTPEIIAEIISQQKTEATCRNIRHIKEHLTDQLSIEDARKIEEFFQTNFPKFLA